MKKYKAHVHRSSECASAWTFAANVNAAHFRSNFLTEFISINYLFSIFSRSARIGHCISPSSWKSHSGNACDEIHRIRAYVFLFVWKHLCVPWRKCANYSHLWKMKRKITVRCCGKHKIKNRNNNNVPIFVASLCSIVLIIIFFSFSSVLPLFMRTPMMTLRSWISQFALSLSLWVRMRLLLEFQR